MIEKIRRFQSFLVELGVARNVLALPAPSTLLLEDHTSESRDGTVIFSSQITEPEISNVARDLFASGHYNIAVSQAYKALDKYVSEKAGLQTSGLKAMRTAFNSKNPILVWSERTSTSERDEQEGYEHIFAGTMQGIRNPTTHEFGWVDSQELALELLLIAQHLLKKAKKAEKL